MLSYRGICLFSQYIHPTKQITAGSGGGWVGGLALISTKDITVTTSSVSIKLQSVGTDGVAASNGDYLTICQSNIHLLRKTHYMK